ncbi:MAG TPA: HAMP domain-containing sensor histidine kinase [Solirubrobacteraceae bacterium]|nr:HAMP domain-containing sensor histidine kinase [Solirubrobacteraceae bacterium]
MILLVFAVGVGSLTVHRIRSDFNRQVAEVAAQLPSQLNIYVSPTDYHVEGIQPPLVDLALPPGHSIIKVLAIGGAVIRQYPSHAPSLGVPAGQPKTVNGYRVVSRPSVVRIDGTGQAFGQIIVQYGRRVSDVEATVARVELLLLLGVLAGSGLALLAGAMIARRAMTPIAQLTSAAAEIARTRDPSSRLPQPEADDEVAELARTLQGMLGSLDEARAETESMLARQRQFVADASHELRTPLTSVLANLELLAESLRGDQGEAAASALRSSQRMRRLVADLLLLARSDVGRVVPREPLDLAQIVVEAAAELGPFSGLHDISLDVHPVTVEASRDELHRLIINLMENAIRHTPPGTEIWVSTEKTGDGQAQLTVQDGGPGVPPELAPTLFERFVRGAGDRGGSFGLGLAIVRAVAESHGGSVTLEPTSERDGAPQGARFSVRLPAAASDFDDDRQHHRTAAQAVVN